MLPHPSSARRRPSLECYEGGCDEAGELHWAELNGQTMNPDTLLSRARARCAHHLNVPGVCSDCFQREMAEMLLEENPELCRNDAVNLVSEWMMQDAETDN